MADKNSSIIFIELELLFCMQVIPLEKDSQTFGDGL
jgi:hypothetical protein